MTLPRRISVALLFALALAALAGAIPSRGLDDDKTKDKIIPSAEMRDHIGKECTAEMTVKSSKNAVPRRTYFLDSRSSDFGD